MPTSVATAPAANANAGAIPPVLAAENVSVRFGGVTALSDVSVRIGTGRRIESIIGPNGAGKTTLFNVLTGVVQPSSGKVLVRGEDVTGTRQDHIFRKGVSRTFQGLRLFEQLTVEQNVTLAAYSVTGRQDRARGKTVSGFWSSKEGLERAHRALDQVGLPQAVRDRKPPQLSLWDSRMVEIARAISSEPDVLLLDEPAAGLNPVEKTKLRELLERLSHEIDFHVLVVEHDMNFVMSIAEHIWVLNFGCLLASGPPSEIQADPRVHEAYLGSPKDSK